MTDEIKNEELNNEDNLSNTINGAMVEDIEPTEVADDTSQSNELESDLQTQLATAITERDDFKDALQRERADFSNFRKRSDREKLEMRSTVAADTIKRFLPVFDDLDRAVTTAPEEVKDSEWYKGFSMIGKKFNDLLESYRIEIVNPLGEPFDHNFHDAIGSDDSDEYESGTVIDVMQKGYVLDGKCIRPAIVRVAN